MIIIKLMGGLGNQMFQYAAARGASVTSKVIYTDSRLYDLETLDSHTTARDYELGIFSNLAVKKAAKWALSIVLSQSKILRLLRLFLNSSIKYIHNPSTKYVPLSCKVKQGINYLDGYFQSEKYFEYSRKLLLKEFQFPLLNPANEIVKLKINNSPNSVSLHIRRGDYLTSKTANDVHGLLPLNYYEKAINTLKTKYNNFTLFVFSDDIAWAKDNLLLLNNDVYFVNGNIGANSWQDMALMTQCNHHIIANSSFSWWGAWLSEKNGEVFAPCKWFNSELVQYDINDIIPARWSAIDHD